ncbi:plastocyanin/azurin family copper-binding protein [Meiothermus cerbereus]|uniref:plastocyanin/azurin family copper-binding protein n=1 Tax=Meiothermus cerbereus TaxID=65552 RepID=UPI003EED2BA6
MRRLIQAGLAALGLLVVFACRNNSPPASTPPDCPATIGIEGFTYSPSSCKVRPGQGVSITASPTHPLRGLGAGNPIPATPATTTQIYTFSAPGTYQYECATHAAQGMKGSITVVDP